MATTEKTSQEPEKEPSAGAPNHEHVTSKLEKEPHPKSSKYNLSVSRNALVVAAIVTGLGVSFLAGVQYQKGHATSMVSGLRVGGMDMAGPGGMGMGGRHGARMGGIGTVTAISSSRITITQRSFGPDPSSSETSKTYTINDATKITVDGATASASDVKTGDTVFIRTDSSSTTIATEIRVGVKPAPSANMQNDTDGSTTDSTDTSTI